MRKTRRPAAPRLSEAGFTLTELMAGLLVASMLLTGIVELTRRYAATSVRMRAASEDIANLRVLNVLMETIERTNPHSLDVRSDRLAGRIGANELDIEITYPDNQHSQVFWRGPGVERTLVLDGRIEFRTDTSGRIELTPGADLPPLASARAMRDAPFDCRFDTVSRTCR